MRSANSPRPSVRPHVSRDGRGGAIPTRADPQVLRARAHGHRGAGAVRRRRRADLSCRRSPSRRSRGSMRRPPSTWTCTTPSSTTRSSGGATPSSSRATFPGSPAICSAPSRCRSRAAAAMPSPWRPGRSKRATDWELTGRKFWITNGAEAGIFIVFANADPSKGYKGITAFIVERDFPGFAVGQEGEQARHPRVEHDGADPGAVPRSRARTCSVRSGRATRSPSRR